MRAFLGEITEIRAILALLLTLTMVAAVFTGQLAAKELELPFATVLGFYFAAKGAEAAPPAPPPPAPAGP